MQDYKHFKQAHIYNIGLHVFRITSHRHTLTIQDYMYIHFKQAHTYNTGLYV